MRLLCQMAQPSATMKAAPRRIAITQEPSGLRRMNGAVLAGVILALITVGATNNSAGSVPIGSTFSSGRTVTVTFPSQQSNATQFITVTGRTTIAYNSSLPSVRIVSLEVNPASCTAYRFTVNATGGNPPYTISWFFGDNSTYQLSDENQTSVLHEYAAPGDYDMTVSVHDTPDTPNGPYYGDVKEIAVVNPASECSTQGYVAVALLLGLSVVIAFAAVVAFRRRRSATAELDGASARSG
jgi:PKD domain-containing protein